MTRHEFEKFIAAPPYERIVSRCPEESGNPYSGQYWVRDVQLAWEVLQEEQRRVEYREKIRIESAAKNLPLIRSRI